MQYNVVNLGDDADTVGAIYGQLAGGYYGVDDIPTQWSVTTYFVRLIELFASELSQFSSKSVPQTDVNWWQLSSIVPHDQCNYWSYLVMSIISLHYQYNKMQCCRGLKPNSSTGTQKLESLASQVLIRSLSAFT